MRGLVTITVITGIAVGAVAGIGGYTFLYARGLSYLTNDPEACNNCHVMNEQFDGWLKSSHHGVAVCNDCHAPHTFFGKYWTKAVNGYFHSYAFTTGDFPETIRITERNRRIAEGNCRYCHAEMVARIDTGHGDDDPMSCLQCHPGVGHPEFVAIGSTPWNMPGDR